MSTRTDTMGTVTATSPLRVRLDGEEAALAVTPGDMVGALVVGDRVYVAIVDGALIVVGRPGGVIGRVANQNLIRNGAFRSNQRGYVSGTYLGANAFAFDGWRARYTVDTKLTFTAAAQGQMVTLDYRAPSVYGLISQTIERANIVPGVHVLSWAGTATARIANASGIGATGFAASPIVVTLDGAEDVEIQLITNSGAATIGNVKLERGSAPTPFVLPSVDDERRACQRYCQVINLPQGVPLSYGFQTSLTQAYSVLNLPVQMRAVPTLTQIGDLYWSDRVTFNTSAISLAAVYGWGTSLTVIHNWTGNFGAASRPGQTYNHAASIQIILEAEV